jgi:hypothetical protein
MLCFSFFLLLMSLRAYADLLFMPLRRVSEFSFRLMKSLHFLTVNISTFLGAGFQVCSVCCHLLLTCPMPPTMSYPWLWETRTCRISNGILVCPRSSSISDSNRYLACRMDGTPAPHRVHVPLVVLLPFMDIAYTFGCQYLMVDHLVPFSCKLQKHDINYYSALFFIRNSYSA